MKKIKQHFDQPPLIPIKLSESEIQAQIVDYLRSCGFLTVRINSFCQKIGVRFIRAYIIHGFKTTSKGFPDLIALKGCHFILLECKAEKGKSSDEQKDFAVFAAKFGIHVLIPKSVDDVRAYMEKFTKSTDSFRKPMINDDS